MHKPPLYPALLIISVIVAVAALIAYVPAKHYVASVQDKVIEKLGEALQKNVEMEVEGARLGLRQGLGFRIYGLVLQEKGTEGEKIFTAKYMFVGLDIVALIRGNLRIKRIYVFKPRIYLVRDATGRFNVEQLFALAEKRPKTQEPAQGECLYDALDSLVWKNQISFKSGEVFFKDLTRDDPDVVRIGRVDLTVRNRLESDRIEIKLSWKVVKPGIPGSFGLRARVTGWKKATSPEELACHVVFELNGVDLKALMACIPRLNEGDDLRGTLSGSLSYEGGILLPGAGQVELTLDRPVIFLTGVHPRPFSPARAVLKSVFDVGRDGLVFSDSRIDLDKMRLPWAGQLDLVDGKVSFLDFQIQGVDLPIVEAASYMPLRLLRGETWRFLSELPRAGRVDVSTILRGSPEDFSRMGTPEGEDALYLRIHFRDCTMKLPVEESYLPFDCLNGVLELARGTLFFRNFDFCYGNTTFAESNGTLRNIHRPASQLTVQAAARLDVGEFFHELDHGIFPDAVRQIARNVEWADGEGDLQVVLKYRYGRGQDHKIRIRGEAELNHVRAQMDTLDVDISRASGRVAFTESGLSSLEMKMFADRSPVHINGSVRFADETSGPGGEIRFESPTLYAHDLLMILGVPGGGIEGVLSLVGSMSWPDGDLLWKADVRGEHLLLNADPYHLDASDLQATLEGRKNSLLLNTFTFRLQGNEVACDGGLESRTPMVGQVEVRSPNLDLNSLLLSRNEDREAIENGETNIWDFLRSPAVGAGGGTDIRLKANLDGLEYRAFFLSDVVVEASLKEGRFRVDLARGTLDKGTILVAGDTDLEDDRYPFSLFCSIHEVQARQFYRLLSLKPGFLQGTISLEGNLRGNLRSSDSRLKSLNGSFHIFSDTCTIKRYGVLSKVLTLINFTQWTRLRLSDLNKKGIPCREINGNFQLAGGVLRTKDLSIDTSVALVSLEGDYNIPSNRLDAALSLRPMEQIDQVLDLIPVVGWVIYGPDGTIVEFYYKLTGPLDDLQVKLVPLRGLNQRIGDPLKRLNRWIRSLNDNKEGRQTP